MGAKMGPKMDEKLSLCWFVVILGALLSSPIFHEILVGKRWDKNPDKSGPGAKRVRGTVILGWPGGMRGASGGL